VATILSNPRALRFLGLNKIAQLIVLQALMTELPEDPQLAQLLDEYVARLQAGERPDRAAILKRYPLATSALDCLEALENMAPEAEQDEAHESTDAGAADVTLPAMPPRRFGQYELLDEIGRGGMGVVYRARQSGLDRLVAVKMILASHLASAEHVRRFQAEARAAARLQHPHIVAIHEVGQLHGQHYFAMEYVEGKSLAQRIAEGNIEFAWAVRTMLAVAQAVDYLHRQAVVHRDLKPSNILLDVEDRPYVTDFGLAKVFTAGSDMTATGVIAGTPSYMSPEQAAGNTQDVGPASDVYSLGAIFYELLTGQPPFRNENPLDTLLQVLGGEPLAPRRINAKIPRNLELICQKCLAKTPGERYASAAELADDLEHHLRGEPLVARPPHVGQRVARWIRRQPALAARLGGIGVFYVVELANFALGDVSRGFHLRISLLLAAWAIASIVCQQFLEHRRWGTVTQFVWGGIDSLLFLAVLLVGNGVASALVIGYALLIVGAGLWFRARFVWFMTLLSLVSYGILVWDFYFRRTDLQAAFDIRLDRHIIFALALVVLGAMVSYLVQRLRALSAYYGRKEP
jgi:serine/threonine-protein kinase